ncbi:hypothetical protein D3C75_462790 [compost metagenome]
MVTSAIRFYESRSLLSKVSDIEAREARQRQNKLPLQARIPPEESNPDEMSCEENAAQVLASMGILSSRQP